MIEHYIFKIKKEDYLSKLPDYMSELENVLEASAIYYNKDEDKAFIESKGMSMAERIMKARELLNKAGIEYELIKDEIEI